MISLKELSIRLADHASTTSEKTDLHFRELGTLKKNVFLQNKKNKILFKILISLRVIASL